MDMNKTNSYWKYFFGSWLIVLAGLYFMPLITGNIKSPMINIVVQDTIMLVVVILLNHFWLKVKINWFSTHKFANQLLISIPIFLYLAFFVYGVAINLRSEHVSNALTLIITSFITALFAGIFEEVYFRGILVNSMFNHFSDKKAVYSTIFITALTFSVSHLIINFNPNDISGLIIQGVSTFGVGVYMAAIYLRTKNIFWPILLHSVNDFVSIVGSHGSTQESNATSSGSYIVPFLTTIIFILLGLFLVRKDKVENSNN